MLQRQKIELALETVAVLQALIGSVPPPPPASPIDDTGLARFLCGTLSKDEHDEVLSFVCESDEGRNRVVDLHTEMTRLQSRPWAEAATETRYPALVQALRDALRLSVAMGQNLAQWCRDNEWTEERLNRDPEARVVRSILERIGESVRNLHVGSQLAGVMRGPTNIPQIVGAFPPDVDVEFAHEIDPEGTLVATLRLLERRPGAAAGLEGKSIELILLYEANGSVVLAECPIENLTGQFSKPGFRTFFGSGPVSQFGIKLKGELEARPPRRIYAKVEGPQAQQVAIEIYDGNPRIERQELVVTLSVSEAQAGNYPNHLLELWIVAGSSGEQKIGTWPLGRFAQGRYTVRASVPELDDGKLEYGSQLIARIVSEKPT